MKRLVAFAMLATIPLMGVGRADFIEVNSSTLTADAAVVMDGVTAIRYVFTADAAKTYSVLAFRTATSTTEVHAFACVPGGLCKTETVTVPDSTLVMTDSDARLVFDSSILGHIDLTWIPGTVRQAFLADHGCSLGAGGADGPSYTATGFQPDSSFALANITGDLGEESFDSATCGAYLRNMAITYSGGFTVN